jgi:hypothetical protein
LLLSGPCWLTRVAVGGGRWRRSPLLAVING